MRNDKKEIKKKRIIAEILLKSNICRIAMMDVDVPYIVPVNYGYNDVDNSLYIHSGVEGKKIDLLRKNKKVCFEIEYQSTIIPDKEPCGWSTKYRSLIGYGSASIITEPEAIVRGLDIIMAHQGVKKCKYEEKHFPNLVIIKISIEVMTGRENGKWRKENGET
jgi:uncharacterized protein